MERRRHDSLRGELLRHLQQVCDISSSAALLKWDQSTQTLNSAAPERSRQISTVQQLAREKFISPRTHRLLSLVRELTKAHPDEVTQKILEVTERAYDFHRKIPKHFFSKFAEHRSRAYSRWVTAREKNDFSLVVPSLEEGISLAQQFASLFPNCQSPTEAILEATDPGLELHRVEQTLEQLKRGLDVLLAEVPLLSDAPHAPVLSPERQVSFALRILRDAGFDESRVRVGRTLHPYTVRINRNDIRLLTRGDYDFGFGAGILVTLHEGGHAMLELGLGEEYCGTPVEGTLPVFRCVSMSCHESQARLWENEVGRSKQLWDRYYPILRLANEELQDTDANAFLKCLNAVSPGPLRATADELSYNVHILIRCELEKALLEGKLKPREVPEAWRAQYQSRLSVTVKDDLSGPLQDVHWYVGLIGTMFQRYALGSVIAANILHSAQTRSSDVAGDVSSGNFASLNAWLNTNIYASGALVSVGLLEERLGLDCLDTDCYLQQLRNRYVAEGPVQDSEERYVSHRN